MSRSREMAIRQWTVFEALRSRRRGLTIAQIVEITRVSRATVYRYLEILEEAGVPLTRERINGEVRHRLMDDALPSFALRPEEVAALVLARQMLEPLDGTRIVEELDRVLRRLGRARRAPARVSVSGPRAEGLRAALRGTLRGIDIAIRDGSRIAFDYSPARGGSRPARRRADPVALRLHRGHPYLIGFDVDRGDYRTFKVARIGGELTLAGPADAHPDYDEAQLFRHAVGIWSGEPVDVAVRLSAEVAARAPEYPLAAGQELQPQPDGAVVVRARVAGLAEVLRWVLAWGADAEALAPEELREAVADEIEKARRRYADGEPEGTAT